MLPPTTFPLQQYFLTGHIVGFLTLCQSKTVHICKSVCTVGFTCRSTLEVQSVLQCTAILSCCDDTLACQSNSGCFGISAVCFILVFGCLSFIVPLISFCSFLLWAKYMLTAISKNNGQRSQLPIVSDCAYVVFNHCALRNSLISAATGGCQQCIKQKESGTSQWICTAPHRCCFVVFWGAVLIHPPLYHVSIAVWRPANLRWSQLIGRSCLSR